MLKDPPTSESSSIKELLLGSLEPKLISLANLKIPFGSICTEIPDPEEYVELELKWIISISAWACWEYVKWIHINDNKNNKYLKFFI